MPQAISAAFDAVLELSLTASAVTVIILFVRLLLRRRAPRWCCWALWAVVLFRLLCPGAPESPASLVPAAGEPVAAAVKYVRAAAVAAAPAGPAAPAQISAAPFDWPAALWLAGAVILAASGAAGALTLRYRLRGARRAGDGAYESARTGTAFVLGLFPPKIYLPEGLTERERECVLAHERVHIRRGDFLIKPLAYLALCLHWFNPLVWLAWVLAMRDMEASCDEAAIKSLGADSRADYAQTLLNLALGRAAVGLPLAFGDDAKRRIKGVANMKMHRKHATVLAAALAAAVMAGCAANPVETTPPPIETPVETPAVTPEPIVAEGATEVIFPTDIIYDTETLLAAWAYAQEVPESFEYTATSGATLSAAGEAYGASAVRVSSFDEPIRTAALETWVVDMDYTLDADPETVAPGGPVRVEKYEYVPEAPRALYTEQYAALVAVTPQGRGEIICTAPLEEFTARYGAVETAALAWWEDVGDYSAISELWWVLPSAGREDVAVACRAARHYGEGWYCDVPGGWQLTAGEDEWTWTAADAPGSYFRLERLDADEYAEMMKEKDRSSDYGLFMNETGWTANYWAANGDEGGWLWQAVWSGESEANINAPNPGAELRQLVRSFKLNPQIPPA